jgi:Uma2 family endonuclease
VATTHDPRPGTWREWPPSRRRSGLFRWTQRQVHRLDELGFFADRYVELLEGYLYEMTIDPPHSAACGLANEVLRLAFGAGYTVRSQTPLDLGRRSLPEPDLAVVAGSIRDHARAHPTTALLVVEISDSTLRKDRRTKSHLYARAGIADYWIVNLVDRQLEIRRQPGPDPARPGRFAYPETTIVPADGSASPLAAPGSVIAVADLLL